MIDLVPPDVYSGLYPVSGVPMACAPSRAARILHGELALCQVAAERRLLAQAKDVLVAQRCPECRGQGLVFPAWEQPCAV